MTELPDTGLQIRSLVTDAGQLELSLAEVEVPVPRDDQVLVRVEAAPINPSDLGLLFAAADMANATQTGTSDRPVVTAPIASAVLAAMTARVGESMPVGNEGAGVVVGAGESAEARAFVRAAREPHYDWVVDSQGLVRSALLGLAAQGRRHGYDRASIREAAASVRTVSCAVSAAARSAASNSFASDVPEV